jgi:hypothetical protein
MKGFVRAVYQSQGGINQDGEPIPAVKTWGEYSPCLYSANTLSNKGVYVGGEFQESSFTITLKNMSFKADFIQLANSKKELVCEKQVLSLEVLDSVKRVKITL